LRAQILQVLCKSENLLRQGVKIRDRARIDFKILLNNTIKTHKEFYPILEARTEEGGKLRD
jgi:hypothetical protein